jgi:hypothetical protein
MRSAYQPSDTGGWQGIASIVFASYTGEEDMKTDEFTRRYFAFDGDPLIVRGLAGADEPEPAVESPYLTARKAAACLSNVVPFGSLKS